MNKVIRSSCYTKALQIIAARHDNQLVSVTNRVKVPEVEQILRYLGVEVVALPGRSECPDPNDDDSALAQIARLERDNPGAYHHTSQFTNPANPQIHAVTTAAELYQDLERIDYVVSGVGTGGSSGGIIEYIRQHQLPTKSIGVVSDTSDFLPGIRTEAELFETGLFNRQWFEALVQVSSGDALAALDQLVRRNGVLAGPTTGACFAALRSHLADHDTLRPDGSRQTAVFIACDRLEPYMSYISKRLPERFGQRRHTDIFDLAVGLEESDACQKTADQATWQWLLQQSATLVDTRGVKPYNLFHIEGSLNYPEEILREVSEQGTPFDQGRPLLFVCPRGDRSLLYANLFRRRGFEAYSLAGGLLAWRAAKLPLVRLARG